MTDEVLTADKPFVLTFLCSDTSPRIVTYLNDKKIAESNPDRYLWNKLQLGSGYTAPKATGLKIGRFRIIDERIDENDVKRYVDELFGDYIPLVPTLTSNIGENGTAGYTIVNGTEYPLYPQSTAYYAFDGVAPQEWNNNTKYNMLIVTYKNGYAEFYSYYNFDEPQRVDKCVYSTVNSYNAGVRPAFKWKVIYSDDGVNWTDAFDYIDIDALTTKKTNYGAEVDNGTHKYWGVQVYAPCEFVSISDIQFYKKK
jgi:hypothetical protein